MNYRVTPVADNVYWVGVVDWNLRDFHGFTTSRGGTYNAFLITGDEPTLIDTVKGPFADEFFGKVRELVDPADIKHFVVNHIEPDHSGAFSRAIQALPNARVYASEVAKIGLHELYDFEREVKVVRSGDAISIAGRTMQFVETPLAHWPDSMVSWLPDDQVLFSSDIFGQLIATSERFDDEIEPPYYDAALYYANIILPFNDVVVKTLDLMAELEVKPKLILPDHGIFWRSHVADILAHYREWATGTCARGVTIVYDSMWGSTEMMSEAIYDTLTERGVSVRKLHIRSTPLSQLVTEIMLSGTVLVGCPTINDTWFHTVAQLLAYLHGLRAPIGRRWASFGSYGWGGGGVEAVHRWMKVNACELIAQPLECRFRPQDEGFARCAEWANAIADQLAD